MTSPRRVASSDSARRRMVEMRRALGVCAGLVLLIAAAAVPVAADTTGGGNRLSSSAGSCDDTTCTETNVSAEQSPFGSSACIDIVTFLLADKTLVSEESGCAPAPSFIITRTLAASFGPTSIDLELCDAEGSCAASRTVIVSASDTPTGPITTTSGHTTTKDGFCTTKSKFTDQNVSVAGTYTIDGITTHEEGDVSTHTEQTKTTCRT